jgi:hypothetical protein
VARRKAAVVMAVCSGIITLEEACRHYQLSEERLNQTFDRLDQELPAAPKVLLSGLLDPDQRQLGRSGCWRPQRSGGLDDAFLAREHNRISPRIFHVRSRSYTVFGGLCCSFRSFSVGGGFAVHRKSSLSNHLDW